MNAKYPNDVNTILDKLKYSPFRQSFHLKNNELSYLQQKGIDTMLRHAADFIRARLAPEKPMNDGKQTPYKGHPVFVAQHATATCCRNCLQKWHKLPTGRILSEEEQRYIVNVIGAWLQVQIPNNAVIQQSLL